MKKRVLLLCFFSISLVLAVFASKRMSVNEIISENVEALSFDDLGNGLIGAKCPERLYNTKTDWNHSNTGYHEVTGSQIWWDIRQCGGSYETCGRATTTYCWKYYVMPVEQFLYLLSQGNYWLLID